METHEKLTGGEPVAGNSDRAFGIILAVVCTLVGLFPLLGGETPRGWMLATAGAVLAVVLFKPGWLAPFNRMWFRFGQWLQRIVHPIIMGVVYFVVVTPTGLVMRALGKDSLRLRRDPNVETYWIYRDPPGPDPTSMKNQH